LAKLIAFKSKGFELLLKLGLLHRCVITFDNPPLFYQFPKRSVKVGEFKGAFKSKAVCAAAETGLFASLVLSTLDNPTIVLSIPETVPVNVGQICF
jgi:hypothetical protein